MSFMQEFRQAVYKALSYVTQEDFRKEDVA